MRAARLIGPLAARVDEESPRCGAVHVVAQHLSKFGFAVGKVLHNLIVFGSCQKNCQMDPVGVRDITADGNARVHVGNSSVTHVHNYVEAQESAPAPFSLIPFSRDPDFVTRGDILDHVAAQCAQPGGRATLVGLGGVGKSQLAIEYAYQTIDKCHGTWVFWVHGGTRGRVEEGFRAIADAVKLPGQHLAKANIPQLLHTWLSNERNGKWLMIIDSADDHDVFYSAERGSGKQPLASYLPQSPNGSILVTTRDHGFAFRLTGNFQSVIKVGPMEPEEAVSLLEKKLGAVQTALAGELVTTLDCIPLAINQAASYIQARSPRCTIEKYLREFGESERNSAKLMAHDSAELRRDGSASNAIMKTWQISFDHIRSKQPSAADLLSLMSFFDHQSIPEAALNPEDEYDSDFDSDLESNWASEELANHASMRHIMDAKQRRENADNDSESDSASEAGGFEDDIALLRDYCLISVNDSGTQFEMHRLVQLATKKWLKASKQHEEFRQLFIHRLAAALPDTSDANELLFRDLYSHLRIASSYRPNKTNQRSWFSLCFNTAWYLGQILSRDGEARALLETALNIWQARKGPKEYNVLVGNTLLAGLMQGMGELEEAEKLLTKNLETLKTTLPPDSRRTLEAMIDLSDIYRAQERYTEAEALQLYVMRKNSAQGGPEDKYTLSCKSSLAATYYYQGRLEEAEIIGLEVLEMSKKVFGPNHYETLSRMTDLALTYSEQDRLEEAVALELQALKLRSTCQSVEDRGSLRTQAHLAQVYNSLQLHDESMRLEKELLQKLISQFGTNHVETLNSMERLADGLKLHGFYEEAGDLYLQILDTFKSNGSEYYSGIISITKRLVGVYRSQCQNSKAESLLTDLLARVAADLGPDHFQTLDIMLSLASIYEWMRQQDKAQGLYCQVLLKFKSYHDMDVLARQLGCWNKLANAEFDDVSRYQELEYMLERVSTTNHDIHGPDHDNTITSLGDLAQVKASLGKLEEAATIHSDIFQSLKMRYGGEHLKTLSSMDHLVKIRKRQGRLIEAKALQSQTLEAIKTKFGTQHERTLAAMQDFGDILMELGEFTEAETIARETLRGEQSLFNQGHWRISLTARFLFETVQKQAVLDESRRNEAAQLFEEFINLCRQQHQGDGREVAGYLMAAAYQFSEMKMADEACSMAEASYDIYKRIAGPEDPDTLYNMGLVAAAWDYNGRYRTSMPLLWECVVMHRQVLGQQHPQTEEVVERYARWMRELEEHDEEHASEQDHPFDTCEACLASKAAREHALHAT